MCTVYTSIFSVFSIRYYLARDLQWEFASLDRQRKGAITVSDVKFLFQMVYGEFFSKFKFERIMQSRLVPNSDISFDEIEVYLCNIPTHDWIDELIVEEDREREGEKVIIINQCSFSHS